ncbi:MAG: phosphoribosylanthranilate isomerase [Woeseia sp.]
MKRFVKICGLTHDTSVEAAIAAGVDALGFVFTDSLRQVSTRHAALIASRVPRHVLRVAVMRHPTVALWREVETIFCPDVLQTDAADFEYLDVSPDITCWPVVRAGAWPADRKLPELFVYEGAASGRGEVVDWKIAAGVARQGRMILAGGLDSDNVAQAIETVLPWGVDVSSSVESAPGVKDPDLIRAFVAAVRATEHAGQKEPDSVVRHTGEGTTKDTTQ